MNKEHKLSNQRMMKESFQSKNSAKVSSQTRNVALPNQKNQQQSVDRLNALQPKRYNKDTILKSDTLRKYDFSPRVSKESTKLFIKQV
jgi:hypothetical protein